MAAFEVFSEGSVSSFPVMAVLPEWHTVFLVIAVMKVLPVVALVSFTLLYIFVLGTYYQVHTHTITRTLKPLL